MGKEELTEKQSILLVEDDESTCRTLTLVFAKKGYEVETARTGREALEKARGRFFNMALLDIKLPDMEGIELLSPLKEIHPDMDMMMVTAYASQETAIKALNEGAYAYILKPLDLDEVFTVVTNILEKQRLVVENRRLFEELQRELAERKRIAEQVERLNTVLQTIRNVNQLIIKEKDRDRLLKGACENLVETRGYISTWIALLDEHGDFSTSYQTGLGEDYISLVERLKKGELPYCCRRALKELGVVEIQDTVSTCGDCPLTLVHGHRSGMSARLECAGKIYGVLIVLVPPDIAIGEKEQSLFLEVTNDIAFALNNIELEEQRKQLFEEREELEQIVNRSPAVVFLWRNAEGWPVEYVSDNVRQFGYDPEDFYSGDIPFASIMHPDDLERVSAEVTQYSQKEHKEFMQEYRIITKTGDVRWLDDRIWIRRDADGVITHYQGIVLDISDRKRVQLRLEERMKELNCLYGISTIVERPGITIKGILQETVQLLPSALQYPEISRARISLNDHIFLTPQFQESPWSISADILASGQKVGTIEVFYIEKRADVVRGEDPFLKEEHQLIKAITEHLGQTIVQKRAERVLHATQRALKTLSAINRAIVHAAVELELLAEACRIIVEIGGYRLAWVGFAEQDREKRVHPVAQFGFDDGYLESVNITWADTERGRGPTGKAIRTGEPSIVRNILTDPKYTLWRADATKRGYASSIALPLIVDAKSIGALNIYAAEPDAFDREEMTLLTELSADLAYGITTLRLRTKHKQAEEALQDSEEKYHELVDKMQEGVLVEDTEGIITFFNPRMADLFNYSEEELIGQHWIILVPEEEHDKVREETTRRPGGISSSYETELLTKDGKIIPVLVNSTPLFTTTGDFRGVLSVFTDITERIRAQEALANSRDHLAEQVAERTRDLFEEKQRIETIIETIPNGIMALNSDGSLSLANRTFKALHREIFREELSDDFNIFETPESYLYDEIRQLISSKKPEPKTIEPVKRLHLQLNAARIKIPGEQPLGVIIESRDVTPFVEFDNLRKQFVSTVSHELRTPITGISLLINNLHKYREKLTETQQEEIIEMIMKSSMILNQMIEDLLIISRIEDRRIRLKWTSFSLWKVLADVSKQLDPKRSIKEITLQLDVSQDIQLLGDQKRISQIFRILFDNAIKFSDNRSLIEVRASVDYQGEYNPDKIDGILIEVSDSGRGISEKDRSRLFERFFRSDDVKDTQGTGLGLAIARELVLLHQGEIHVDSELGKGTTFSVFLPRADKEREFVVPASSL